MSSRAAGTADRSRGGKILSATTRRPLLQFSLHWLVPAVVPSAVVGLSERGGAAGTIFAFRSTDEAQAKAEKCLESHSSTRSLFFASPHGQAAMDCTNCHGELMKSSEEKPTPSEI